MFESEYIGMQDKHGERLHNGDKVLVPYKGKFEPCTIVYNKGMFCLMWQDGYINHYPLNTERYKKIQTI